MTVLSDNTLYKLKHDLFPNQELEDSQFQPASIDLTLDKEITTIQGNTMSIEDYPCLLQPDQFILGSTKERIRVPVDLLARVEGRSSIGRLGIMIHITAGFIDPGFEGNITLEIKNVSDQPFPLRYGDRICQVVFEELDQTCIHPYDGKYQNDTGVVLSRWED